MAEKDSIFVVRKFPLWDVGPILEATIHVPRHARFLTAQLQGTKVVLWAGVNPEEPTELVGVRVVMTGQPIPLGFRYLSTVQHGGLALHVFVNDVHLARR